MLSCCTFYITGIFLTALIPMKLNLLKHKIVHRRHSSIMNSGDNGNQPFSPSNKNSWLRKRNKQTKKTPNIFSVASRDVWKSHWNPLIMLSLIWIKRLRKGTNKTLTRSWQEKPQVTVEWVINKQCGPCTSIFKLQPWLIGKQQMTTAAVWLLLVPEWKTSLELTTMELNCWDLN